MSRASLHASLRGSVRLVFGQLTHVSISLVLLLIGASFAAPPARRQAVYVGGADAAAMALREMGMPIDRRVMNGEVPALLCRELNRAYHTRGISCEYRHLDCIDDLCDRDGAIAIIDSSAFTRRYVVVICVDEVSLTVADPLNGTVTYARSEFRQKWRGGTIVFNRKLRWATDYVMTDDSASCSGS